MYISEKLVEREDVRAKFAYPDGLNCTAWNNRMRSCSNRDCYLRRTVAMVVNAVIIITNL